MCVGGWCRGRGGEQRAGEGTQEGARASSGGAHSAAAAAAARARASRRRRVSQRHSRRRRRLARQQRALRLERVCRRGCARATGDGGTEVEARERAQGPGPRHMRATAARHAPGCERMAETSPRMDSSMLWLVLADVSNQPMKPCSLQKPSSCSRRSDASGRSHLLASRTTGSGLPLGSVTFESISRFHLSTLVNVSSRDRSKTSTAPKASL